MELHLVVSTDGDQHDIVVEADQATMGGAFAEALARHLSLPDGEYLARCERIASVIGADVPLASCGLRYGDTVTLTARAAHRNMVERARSEFVVTSGPDDGTHHPLRSGDYQVGRDPARCDIVLSDPKVSGLHLRLRVSAGGIAVSDLNSTNGTFIGGHRLRPLEWQDIAPSQDLRLGDSIARVVADSPALGRSPTPNGLVPFNRPPRVVAALATTKIEIPRPPDAVRGPRFSIPQLLMPFVGGGVLVLSQVLRQPPAGSSDTMWLLLLGAGVIAMVISPLAYAWTFLEDRGSGRKDYREAENEFRERVAAAAKEVASARNREVAWRERTFPKPGALLRRVTNHDPSVWERRPGDGDYLHLRIGTASRRAAAEVRFEEGGSRALRDEARRAIPSDDPLPSVPVDIPMERITSVGIAGSGGDVEAVARWMVSQAAALHSPRDLAIAAVLSQDAALKWDWLKWLPHSLGEGSPLRGPHVAVGNEAARSLMDSALATVRTRSQERSSSGTLLARSSVLVLIDGQAGLDRATASRILEAPPELGVLTIWMGARLHELPGGCRGVVEIADGIAKWTAGGGGEATGGIVLDAFPADDARALALAIAPLRDVSADTVAASIPRNLTLFDLLGVDEPTGKQVLEHWELSKDDVSAPIGRTATAPFAIDLRRDGPHGLIAGTTGAGKSELLQTIIASLATRHRPDRLTFLLVDYKGGAAFKDCVGLPHTLGMVTDLDEHLAQRAIVSLNAELKRRERILASAGAKDLTTMAIRDPAHAPARLAIVIDEFATLAREVPAFVDGVVDIAQRGRSLGVHLLLATQRPAGVITANIKANTNLRIALRVADPNDSDDVIGGPEASAIGRDLPGRAFARIGHDQVIEFQTAYAGAPASVERGSSIVVREFTLQQRPAPRRSGTALTEVTTQLARLVDALGRAASDAKIPRQPAPWLPPLAEVVPLQTLALGADAPPGPTAILGLTDDPAHQEQRPAVFDLANDGSLLIYGASGSGKTTLMRSLAVSLALGRPPDELNIYGVDMATGGLKSLEALPHCGTVIVGNDEERVVRLFTMLHSSLEVRRRALAEVGVSTIADLPATLLPRFPRTLVLLNGYGAFASAYERSAADPVATLARLVADGRGVGIHFVIGAERRGAVPGALAGVVPKRVVLRMSDDDEYANLGLSRKQYEKVRLPPGRGFYEDNLAMQCAVVGDDATGRAQADAITLIGTQLRQRHPSTVVWKVDLLPDKVDRASLPTPTEANEAVIGILDRDLAPARVSLTEGHFVVLGPYRSGRSTALETIVESLRVSSPHLRFNLLAPRPSPLTRLDYWANAARSRDQCGEMIATLAATLRSGDRLSQDVRTVLLIDDGEELLDDEISEPLSSIVRRGRDSGVRVLAAIERQAARRAFGGWFSELKKEGRALVLQPDLDADGDLFGVRLRQTAVRLNLGGRGYLLERGTAHLIQIASAGR